MFAFQYLGFSLFSHWVKRINSDLQKILIWNILYRIGQICQILPRAKKIIYDKITKGLNYKYTEVPLIIKRKGPKPYRCKLVFAK